MNADGTHQTYQDFDQVFATRAQMVVNDLRTHQTAMEEFAERIPEPHSRPFRLMAERIAAILKLHFKEYDVG